MKAMFHVEHHIINKESLSRPTKDAHVCYYKYTIIAYNYFFSGILI